MSSSASAPVLGITLGDPTGIGPTIIARALAEAPAELRRRCRVYGDAGVLARVGATLPADVVLEAVTALSADEAPAGTPTRAGGAAQIAYLERALADAQAGRLGALVTAPIHKASAKSAGFAFPGHTELLAARLGAAEVAMLFAGPRLRVVLATIHEALADVPRVLTPELVARATALAAIALVRDFGVARPRVAVLGLNPHAGEDGHFGDEEARIIAPGIALARARIVAAGIEPDAVELAGPLVPDAVWRGADGFGRWDSVVAMYHDQGLIPVKLVDFEDAVNVTLGLPIVRTSPDHGTAHDLAASAEGRARARHAPFAQALALADRLSLARAGR